MKFLFINAPPQHEAQTQKSINQPSSPEFDFPLRTDWVMSFLDIGILFFRLTASISLIFICSI